jgi:cytochrome P450
VLPKPLARLTEQDENDVLSLDQQTSRIPRMALTRFERNCDSCSHPMAHGRNIPVTVSADRDLHYDPYDVELNINPFPVFARIREEAPLYYNPELDFYALSRYDDVNKAVIDHETFISGRGALLEIIKSGMEIPPGTLIFEDPPIHNIHRNLLSRVFTPRKVAAL